MSSQSNKRKQNYQVNQLLTLESVIIFNLTACLEYFPNKHNWKCFENVFAMNQKYFKNRKDKCFQLGVVKILRIVQNFSRQLLLRWIKLSLWGPTPKNGQTYSNNLSANSQRIV